MINDRLRSLIRRYRAPHITAPWFAALCRMRIEFEEVRQALHTP